MYLIKKIQLGGAIESQFCAEIAKNFDFKKIVNFLLMCFFTTIVPVSAFNHQVKKRNF